MTELMNSDPAAAPTLICLRCEYDLRGLSRDGQCPECGSAIEQSYRRMEELHARGIVPLALAPRRWLTMMWIGCLLTILSVIPDAVQAFLLTGRYQRKEWL